MNVPAIRTKTQARSRASPIGKAAERTARVPAAGARRAPTGSAMKARAPTGGKSRARGGRRSRRYADPQRKARRTRNGRKPADQSAESVLTIPIQPDAAGKEPVVETDGRDYEQGYRDGLFDGGERLLEERLPPDILIPDASVETVLSAGVDALRSRGMPLLSAVQTYEMLERALAQGQPFSLVRLGDGELLTLAQNSVLPIETVVQEGDFLPYAGVNVPDLRARDELIESIRRASLIGVPLSRRPYFQPLLFSVWRAFGIRPESLRLTISTINFSLQEQGLINRLLAGRRILIIGDVALPLAQRLASRGVAITGAIQPVRGVADIERVVEEASRCVFDLALVSAGIAAVTICVRLAERTGRVAIDFGHQANVVAGILNPSQHERRMER
ncbi:GT-D fold domain-containing glycosyltransferase [Cohnella zeiphila]|uniref:Succinyl-CoA synthetase n=1 Tax=Cohnella zeiphila TaxID=2761120 RepID=A0A7X0STU9_9BACL|nr:GT-D fold domain-containing glycosyltransferase [Cohnella zeiphila]MBB6736010.1 succinyl-CoA synthetase [Cohnella zeiphila]